MLYGFVELWRYRDLLWLLTVRDLRVRYRNSVLGVAWSWMNPLLMMLVFTFVFTVMSRGPADLPNFHAFVLVGILAWNTFAASVQSAAESITANAALVRKVYFPREVFPLSVVLSNLLNFLISLPIYFVVAWASGIQPTPWLLLLPLTVLAHGMFTAGVALAASAFHVFYRDTAHILQVLLLAWFFLTPIFYPISILPRNASFLWISIDVWLWTRRLNPMASIIASYHDLLYYGTYTAPDFLIRTIATSGLVLLAGYALFRRLSPRFAEEV
ncbi:MAG: ABC transporter permease [Anaerolineae bacterium]|nr:ABC transporter permease [Thermoflexus sp.]MDW8064133.1 ABC transporter permease [Anaerolineae bacterium]